MKRVDFSNRFVWSRLGKRVWKRIWKRCADADFYMATLRSSSPAWHIHDHLGASSTNHVVEHTLDRLKKEIG